jgi:ferric-dicitrate binding protein FerR (iron transport regulator)
VLSDYQNYTATDFLDDTYFIEWRTAGNEEISRWWNVWLLNNPDKKDIVQQAIEQHNLLTNFKKIKPTPDQQNITWFNIEQQIHHSHLIHNKTKLVYWLAAAVVVIVIIAVGLMLFNSSSINEILITSSNKPKTIILSNGSVITLNNASSLKYKSNNEREVWLEGSAYFVIKPALQSNQKVPFLVHAGQLQIHVLGTTFSVVNTQQQCVAVLQEGKITATAFSKTKQIVPGEKISLIQNELKVSTVNAALYNPWIEGSFHFDKTNMEELSDIISVFYERKLIIKNKERFKAKSISGIVTANDTTTFIKTLEILLDANIELKEKEIIINPK